MFGYEASSLIGKYWYELLPEEDRAYAQTLFKNIVKKGKSPHSIPMRGLKSNGEIVNLWVRWNYLKLENSSIFGIFAVITDISDIITKREQILNQEQEIELISSKTPCAFFNYNYKSKRFHASCKWKKLHSIDKGAKIDTLESLEKFLDKSVSQTLIRFINSFEGDGIKEIRYTIETSQEKRELISAAKARFTKKDGVIRLSGVTFQIESDEDFETEHKDLYKELIRKNPSIMLTFDPESLKILDFNKAFLKLTGFCSEELKDKYLFELFPVEGQKLTIISKEISTRSFGTYSTHIRCKNSKTKDVLMNCSLQISDKTKFVFCIIEDQTEKNMSLRKLFEKERENNKFKENLQSLVSLECEKKLMSERTSLIRTGYEALKFSTDFICENVESNLENIYQIINKVQNRLKDEDIFEKDLLKHFEECNKYFDSIHQSIAKFKDLKSTKFNDGSDVACVLKSCTEMYVPIWQNRKIKYDLFLEDEIKVYPKDKGIFKDLILSIYSIITKGIIEASKQDKSKNFELRVLMTIKNNFASIEIYDNAHLSNFDSADPRENVEETMTKFIEAASSLTMTYLNGILLYTKKHSYNIFQLKIPIIVL